MYCFLNNLGEILKYITNKDCGFSFFGHMLTYKIAVLFSFYFITCLIEIL